MRYRSVMGAGIVRETFKYTHRVMVKNDSDESETAMRFRVSPWTVAAKARAKLTSSELRLSFHDDDAYMQHRSR